MSNSVYRKAKIIGKSIEIYNEYYCNILYYDIVKCWTVGNEICFLIRNKILGRTEFLHLKIGNELLNKLNYTKEIVISYYLDNEIQSLRVSIECIDSKTYIAYNILGFKSGRLVSVDCDYESIKRYYTKEFGWVAFATDGIFNVDSILITENKTFIQNFFEKNGKKILLRTSNKKLVDRVEVYVKEIDKCKGLIEAEAVE